MVKNMTYRLSMLGIKIVYNLFINRDGITIKNLSENIKIDYKNTYNSAEELFKAGIIKKEKIGNYSLCKLNYSNEDIVEYLKEYNFFRLKFFRKKHPDIYTILTEACQKTTIPFFICLLFGSYAKNEENKGSDVDVLTLTNDELVNKEVNTNLKNSNKVHQIKLDINEQLISDFIKDLKDKDKVSLANEVSKGIPIVFYGDDIFFRILIEDRKKWQF